MQCTEILSLTVKPEDFSHIDDNIGKSSGKASISNASTAGPKDDGLQLSETHTRHTKESNVDGTENASCGEDNKSNDTLAPISIFATQNSPRNNARLSE